MFKSMRFKLLMVLTAMFCVVTMPAQDILVKTDGSALQVKVDEITESAVKYHRFDNLTGPVYTIPLASVLSITYENGVTETFSSSKPTPEEQTATETDGPALTPQTPEGLDEAKLLRLSKQFDVIGENPLSPSDYVARAKKYRKIAWIGGGSLLVVGAVLPTFIWGSDQMHDTYFFFGLPIMGGAVIWCAAWNIAAYMQMKKARDVMAYSVALVEWDVMKWGKERLAASVNVMGNNNLRSGNMGLGLGLSYTF